MYLQGNTAHQTSNGLATLNRDQSTRYWSYNIYVQFAVCLPGVKSPSLRAHGVDNFLTGQIHLYTWYLGTGNANSNFKVNKFLDFSRCLHFFLTSASQVIITSAEKEHNLLSSFEWLLLQIIQYGHQLDMSQYVDGNPPHPQDYHYGEAHWQNLREISESQGMFFLCCPCCEFQRLLPSILWRE